jgi:hypothetical protein
MFLALDDWGAWAEDLSSWLDSRFNESVLARFDYSADLDWLEWLDRQQADIDGTTQSSVELFRPFIQERYEGVRAFHATRLEDLSTVHARGLCAWSAEELALKAREKLTTTCEESLLEKAIDRGSPRARAGRVYLFASMGHALGTHGDLMPGRIPPFCLAGSEFLQAVSGFIHGPPRGQQKPGRAYILACNLNWSLLTDEVTRSVTKHALNTIIAKRFSDTRGINMLGNADCIPTNCDVPPGNIELVADVEALIGRDDLQIADVEWTRF